MFPNVFFCCFFEHLNRLLIDELERLEEDSKQFAILNENKKTGDEKKEKKGTTLEDLKNLLLGSEDM